uniref:CUB domain-containing protein n=1 Tax=Branchiostoma floridae TaxID=7739 RepID=C3YYH0_BRAFL|eukprot:XP_002598598.1 hypothetical protein BRAFLDRAFT_66992 [Branchiostoma floridae]
MSLFAILLALVLVFIDGALSACSNGGSFTTFSSQSFTTDNYPGTYPYEPCEWSVTVPVGSVVLLSFDAFDLGTNFVGSCINDYIEVYDGDSATGTLLGQYCGTSLPPDLLTTSNIMTVKLTVGLSSAFNSFNTQTGFSAVFTASAAGLDSGCGNIGTYNGQSSGSFSTMNYGSGQYDNSATCTWEITVTSGMYVALSFSSFDVDTFTCAGNDKVTVYYGVGSGLSEEGSYCGTNSGIGSYPPATVYSCTNEMTVIFTSDSSGTNSGFLASFLESAYSTSCTGTGSTMTSTTGTLQTMNYPSAYDSYSNCTWEIQVAAVSSVSLSFDNFRVGDPNDTNCTADYVAVYDGLSPNTVLMGTYCTWATPPNITVSSGELTIIFISDGVDNTQGFSATYTVTHFIRTSQNSSIYSDNASSNDSSTDYNKPSDHGCPNNHGYTLYSCCNNNDCSNNYCCTHYNSSTNDGTTYNRSPHHCATYNRSPHHCATYNRSPHHCATYNCSPHYCATYHNSSDNRATFNCSYYHCIAVNGSHYDYTTFNSRHNYRVTVYYSLYYGTAFHSASYNRATINDCPNYYTTINTCLYNHTSVDSTSYNYTTFHRCPFNHPAFDTGHYNSAALDCRPYNCTAVNISPNNSTAFNSALYNYTNFNNSADYTASYNSGSNHCTTYNDTCTDHSESNHGSYNSANYTSRNNCTRYNDPAANNPSGVLTDQYGSVSSMNYPFPYLNNAYCEWVIAVGAGLVIQLQFNAFVLEPSTADPNCTKDYVKVYQGTGSSKTLAGTYCGQSIPATFTSSGNTMSVSFTSDGSFTYQGFIAVYTAIQLTTQGTTTVTPATPWISFTESIIAVVFLCLLALLVIAMAAYCVYATCRKKPKVADGESNPLKANNQKANNGKNSDKGIELPPYNGTKPPKQAFGPNTAAAAGAVAGGAAVGGTAAAVAANSNAAGKKSILKNGGSGGSGQEAPVTASSKFAGPAAGAGGAAAGTGTGVAVGAGAGAGAGVAAGAGASAGIAAGLGAGAAAGSFNPTLPGAVPNNTVPKGSRLAPGPNDGYAIDPVTGREYVFDKKTGKRFWSPSPAEIAGGVWSTPLVTIKAANKFKKNANLNF